MEAAIFPKQIKLDDYEAANEKNVLTILESSNLLLGNGVRTSQTAIVVAKTLHFMFEEGEIDLKGIHIIDLGCGIGFLGIYLSCLGANVTMIDVPHLKESACRNINLNKQMIKGNIEYLEQNWKNKPELSLQNVLTIVCECGDIEDLFHQLQWVGEKGMLICFLERENENSAEYLCLKTAIEYLRELNYNFDFIEMYHPDYFDNRIKILQIHSNKTFENK